MAWQLRTKTKRAQPYWLDPLVCVLCVEIFLFSRIVDRWAAASLATTFVHRSDGVEQLFGIEFAVAGRVEFLDEARSHVLLSAALTLFALAATWRWSLAFAVRVAPRSHAATFTTFAAVLLAQFSESSDKFLLAEAVVFVGVVSEQIDDDCFRIGRGRAILGLSVESDCGEAATEDCESE